MAFPLATVLSAAPGLISAAADLVKLINRRRQPQQQNPLPPVSSDEQFEELHQLIEKQAKVIEELALNNQQLTLAIRNNRIIALAALAGTLLLALLSVFF